jgi:hypothetical protein
MKTLPGFPLSRTESANLAGSEDEAKALEAERRAAAKRCEAERFGYLSSRDLLRLRGGSAGICTEWANVSSRSRVLPKARGEIQ